MSSSAALYDNLSKIEQYFFDAMALALIGFYSYAAVLEPAATQYHRGVYVIITYILVFLIYRSRHPVMRVIDYVLIALSIVSIGYWIWNFEAINYRTGAETQLDAIMAMIGVLIGITWMGIALAPGISQWIGTTFEPLAPVFGESTTRILLVTTVSLLLSATPVSRLPNSTVAATASRLKP